MSNLVKYNAARIALAEAHRVDEVKDIRDKAEAMAAYARQAKDSEMIQWVTEIKVRAERRAGQLLAEMPKAKGESGRFTGGNIVVPPAQTKTLADLGITKNESSRWQKLAGVSDEKFEHAVSAAKEVAGEVTTAAMLRSTSPDFDEPAYAGQDPAPDDYIDIDDYTELDAALDQVNELEMALAVARMGNVADDQKQYTQNLITSLQAEVKTLTATLKSVCLTRDSLMEENAQLKIQCKMNRREIDRLKSK